MAVKRDTSLNFRQFTVGPWQVEYLIFGRGNEMLLAFHGFDNDAQDLKVFETSLGEDFTIISVNLFFHGNSTYTGEADKVRFDREQLKLVMDELLISCNVNRFSLLGYSLGGRVCLTLAELYPDRIDRLFLLASDGLIINRWYSFLTGTYFGREVFRRVVRRPDLFLTTAELFRKLKVVGEKQYKFARSYFDTQEKREKVFKVWMIYRLLLPNQKLVATNIRKQRISCHLLFGSRDTIIPSKNANRLIKEAGSTCHVHLIETGHQLIRPDVGKFIKENCLK